MHSRWTIAFGLCAALSLSAGAAAAASFRGLGFLLPSAPVSNANALSADGSVAVGVGVSEEGNEAFRWTEAGGMLGLGDLPGGLFISSASAASEDGSVIVGGSDTGGLRNEPFRWTEAEGIVGLGHLPGGDEGSAFDVSADGSVIVGQDASQPFRWEGGVMVSLGTLTGGGTGSAFGVTPDGSLVVGTSDTPLGIAEAFRWTQQGGMVGLGDLPGGTFKSSAVDVSADGSVIVGVGSPSTGFQEAFRWTEQGGIVGLGDTGGARTNSGANAVSADGSVVVGFSSDGAFIWDATNGMRSLRDVLQDDFGLDLGSWKLQNAKDTSADGLTIVGTGTNPEGRTEAWIATLPEPDPSLFLALGWGLLALLAAFRRSQKKSAGLGLDVAREGVVLSARKGVTQS